VAREEGKRDMGRAGMEDHDREGRREGKGKSLTLPQSNFWIIPWLH